MPDTKPPLIILDTNVVFDWLLFKDASCKNLGLAIESGLIRWVTTVAMLDEVRHVLARGSLDSWHPAQVACLEKIGRYATLIDPGEPEMASRMLVCSDADDQKFIDLAVDLRAAWLLTRDRALLQLCRGAQKLGVAVLTPVQWRFDFGDIQHS